MRILNTFKKSSWTKTQSILNYFLNYLYLKTNTKFLINILFRYYYYYSFYMFSISI